MQDDHLYSAEEVAKRFTLKPKTVMRYAAEGRWPHVRLPGYGGGYRYVFTGEQLDQILAMMTVDVPPVTIRPAPPRRTTKKSTSAKQKAS